MNKQEMAEYIVNVFQNYEAYYKEHLTDFGNVLPHVFASETINDLMLLQEDGNPAVHSRQQQSAENRPDQPDRQAPGQVRAGKARPGPDQENPLDRGDHHPRPFRVNFGNRAVEERRTHQHRA